MMFEIPDHCLNAIQIDSIRSLLAAAKGMHYADITLRVNGRDAHFQADWLKSVVVLQNAAQPLHVTEIERDGGEVLTHLSDGRCAVNPLPKGGTEQ